MSDKSLFPEIEVQSLRALNLEQLLNVVVLSLVPNRKGRGRGSRCGADLVRAGKSRIPDLSVLHDLKAFDSQRFI